MFLYRDETLPKLLPAENIFRFKAKWSETDGVNEQDQKEYLAQFCDTFKRALIEQIGECPKFIIM